MCKTCNDFNENHISFKEIADVVYKLKDERNRFLTIAYNAICLGQLDERFSKEDLFRELGCTEEEYNEIME